MLFIPEGDSRYKVLAIDPGSTTLGVSMLSYDIRTSVKRVEFSYTLNATKRLHQYQSVVETSGERFARLLAHQKTLLNIFIMNSPNRIISESPFLSRFPQAFGALTECFFMIESAVRLYDPFLYMERIDPASAKVLMGVSGKSGDKELMRNAVLSINDLEWGNVDKFSLDEHSCDSLAIAYGKLNSILYKGS